MDVVGCRCVIEIKCKSVRSNDEPELGEDSSLETTMQGTQKCICPRSLRSLSTAHMLQCCITRGNPPFQKKDTVMTEYPLLLALSPGDKLFIT